MEDDNPWKIFHGYLSSMEADNPWKIFHRKDNLWMIYHRRQQTIEDFSRFVISSTNCWLLWEIFYRLLLSKPNVTQLNSTQLKATVKATS